MSENDAEFIRRFKNGDAAAFADLIQRWEASILNLAFRMTGRIEDAEDIRQLSFLRVHRGLATYDGNAGFSTWLHRIVINVCRDHLRARRADHRRRAIVGSNMMRSPNQNDSRVKAEEPPSPPVAEAVAALPDDLREVIVLRHYCGHSFMQVAEILGEPASTVKSRALRALRTLREVLETSAGKESESP